MSKDALIRIWLYTSGIWIVFAFAYSTYIGYLFEQPPDFLFIFVHIGALEVLIALPIALAALMAVIIWLFKKRK
ncbi:MAG: hypothetical protein WCD70_06365 [Alphaproteobacteria bacterium]